MPNAALVKKLVEQVKALEALRKQNEELQKKAKALEAKAKLAAHPVFALSGFLAAYMSAVRQTDGLLSVMPSCLKALQAAEKSATVETVNAAIKGVGEQQKYAEKQAASDPSKKKALSKFLAEMTSMNKKLGALL